MPGLDGSPRELVRLSLLVGERHGRDVVDSFVTRFALGDIDRSENFHLDVDRRTLHGYS